METFEDLLDRLSTVEYTGGFTKEANEIKERFKRDIENLELKSMEWRLGLRQYND